MIYESPSALKVLRNGTAEAARELNSKPRHMLDEGNPNHPMYDQHIFGYHVDEFMARQYR